MVPPASTTVVGLLALSSLCVLESLHISVLRDTITGRGRAEAKPEAKARRIPATRQEPTDGVLERLCKYRSEQCNINILSDR